MKYEAVIETDDYEDFEFFEDGNGKYIHGIDAGAVNNEWIALYFKECKQESILDKIRAEIEKVSFTHYFEYGEYLGEDTRSERIVNYNEVMQIIDKYKAESEE